VRPPGLATWRKGEAEIAKIINAAHGYGVQLFRGEWLARKAPARKMDKTRARRIDGTVISKSYRCCDKLREEQNSSGGVDSGDYWTPGPTHTKPPCVGWSEEPRLRKPFGQWPKVRSD